MGITIDTIDLINSGFVLFAAVGAWANVFAYLRDRRIEGVAWSFTIGYSLWGLWNLYFYFALGQMVSWACEFLIIAGNIIWLWLVVKDKVKSVDLITDNTDC